MCYNTKRINCIDLIKRDMSLQELTRGETYNTTRKITITLLFAEICTIMAKYMV